MADYSTAMGILQPQVGKSGDILLKFEHKNGGERGFDKGAQATDVRQILFAVNPRVGIRRNTVLRYKTVLRC